MLLFSFQQSYAQPGIEWEFSRDITFSTSTPLADFQVKIELNGATQHSHMKANGSDLRFYVGSTECSYWIERFNPTGTSVIWVRVSAIITSGLTMYYGNPAATTTSNGETTFDFFDGFDGAALSSKWTVNSPSWDPGSIIISSGQVELKNKGDYTSMFSQYDTTSLPDSYIIELKHKESGYFRNRFYVTDIMRNESKTITGGDYGFWSNSENGSTTGYIQRGNDAPVSANTDYLMRWDITRTSGDYRWSNYNYLGGNRISNESWIYPGVSIINISVTEQTYNSTFIDWVRIRKSGTDPAITIDNEFVRVPVPIILSVSKLSGCEGEIFTITGTFPTNFGHTVRIGSASIKIETESATTITTKFGAFSGNLSVETTAGTSTESFIMTATPLPVVNAGSVLTFICSQGTSAALGGTVTGGVGVTGVWSVDIPGGTFILDDTDFTKTTWTAPAGFSGQATFTLSGNNGSCSSNVTKAMVVNATPSGTVAVSGLNFCVGESVTFKAPLDYTGYEFLITQGGTTSTVNNGSNPVYKTNNLQAGATVKVKVTNNGCVATLDTDPFTVNIIPSGNFLTSDASGNKNNDSTICKNEAINFSFSNTDFLKYAFILNGIDTLQNTNVSYLSNVTNLQNGDKLTMQVMGGGGCSKLFGPITVKVYNNPSGTLSSNRAGDAICLGGNLIFTAKSGFVNYEFLLNGETSLQGPSPARTYISGTELVNNDEISVKVKNSNGCFAQIDTVKVTVHDLPGKPTIEYGSQLPSFCEGDGRNIDLSVNVPENSNYTYQWYKNGATYGTNTSILNLDVVSETGRYSVSFVNENGCTSSQSDPVEIAIYPVASKPTVTVSGPLEFCEGGSVVLTSSEATTYQWYYGASEAAMNPISGQTSQTLPISDVTETGYYAVGVTNENDCAGSAWSNNFHVVVNALPAIPVITITSGDLELCDGETVTLSAPLSSTYKWYKEGSIISGATNQSYSTFNTALAAGEYTVEVTNSKGCLSPTSLGKTVVVNPLPIPIIDGPSTICLGTFENVYSTEIGKDNYVWTVTGGGNITSGSTSNSISVDWSSTPGVRNLNVLYTDDNGCRSNTQASFTNSPAVKPTIAGAQQVCVGLTEVEYTTEGEQNSDYEWTVSAGGTITSGSTTNIIKVTWTGAGLQTISVNYTNKDNCNAPSPIVWPVTVSPVPIAEFSYSNTPYCSTADSASPTMATGATEGTFSYTPAGLNLSIHPSTGLINTISSDPGIYTITNTIAAAGGCGVVSETAQITLTKLPIVNINYDGAPFCTSDANLKSVAYLSGEGAYLNGVFTAPSGLTIDGNSGAISPSTSTSGSYTITYTISESGGCAEIPVQTSVTITELPTVTLSYDGHEFCKRDIETKSPSLDGSKGAYLGGTYSVLPAGLNINPTNGYFTPSGSDVGNYTVTYTTPASANCGEVIKTFEIIITEIPTATISYSNSPVCNTETSLLVTLSGGGAYTGGIYTTSPAGLSINVLGDINPSESIPGNYTITYTIPLSGGCTAVPITTAVTISPKPEVNAGTNWVTCVGEGPVNITQGVDTAYASNILWSGGTGIWSQATSLTGAIYESAASETGDVILTLTATGRDGCSANTSISTKKLIINTLPSPVYIIPANAPSLCVGGIQSFISVKDNVSEFNTGPLPSSTSPVSIPDNATAGIFKDISVSGIPSNAVITSVELKLNVTHTFNGDLTINLKAPNGKVLNIANALPGPGFINTIISSAASNPIQTSGDMGPFTGTYAAQMRYGTQGATSVPGNRAFAKSFDELFSIPNGNWILSVRDGGTGDEGSFNSWTIIINYSIPVDAVPVFWTTVDAIPDNLYLDASATIPYTGDARTVVYAKPAESGAYNYKASSVSTFGCKATQNVTLNISPSPKVFIKADYCENSEDGKITLYAMGVNNAINYNWSTGETTASVLVDIAHEYDVSVTNSQGCTGTGILSVAEELVVNGDFEQGNEGFYTEYLNMPPPNPTPPSTPGNGLIDEGTYALDTNAYVYHQDFHGRDHTTSAQSGKFMIVNGLSDIVTTTKYPDSHKRIIWEQTVSVLQNTDYYFSAWAMNFSGSNSPRLQFEVNGVPVGTIANLQIIPRVLDEDGININNWVRFYNGISNGIDDTWKSEENTEAVIRIINLEPELSGNDFGLDDISFGTLAPFVSGPDISGRDEQTICVGESLQPIVYKVGSGDEPIDGLPDTFENDFDGLYYTISGGSLTVPGVYEYVLQTTGNCPIPATATGKITVLPNPEITLISTSPDATLCLNNNLQETITFNVVGAANDAVFTGLPAGITGVYNFSDGTATISGSASATGFFNYKLKTEGICKADSVSGVIAVDALPIAGTISSSAVCLNDGGVVKVSGYSGEIRGWAMSEDGVNYTPIPNTSDTEEFTNITQTRYYKVDVGNGVCPAVASVPVSVSIQNLWEGKSGSAWDNPFNWASQNTPTINTSVCGGIVTIPKVVGMNKDPILTTTAGVTYLNVLTGGNLTILPGGNLQVAGDITNNGILNARNGGIEYTGNTARTVESNIFLNNAIGDLKINTSNNNGVTLNAPIDIFRSLTFGSNGKKLITNDHLTLKSTKEETAWLGDMTGKTITGKATVERFINTGTVAQGGHDKSWQLLAIPTTGQSIKDSWMEGATTSNASIGNSIPGSTGNPHQGYGTMITSAVPGADNQPTPGFDVFTAPGPSMKSFDPVTNNYDAGPESTALPIYNPKGYLVLVRGDRSVYTSNGTATPTTLRTKGNLITGKTPIMTFQPNTWNSVGNPYASAIDLKYIDKSGSVGNVFAVWDPLVSGSYGLGGYTYLSKELNGDYLATPPSASYPGSQTIYIQSGQAFLVQTAPGQDGSIGFTENTKVGGSKMVMRPFGIDSRVQQLRTNLYGLKADGSAFISDGTLNQFGIDYSNEIDGLDARKMSNASENLSIKSNSKLLAIERSQPIMENDTIFYNLTGMRVQNYRMDFITQGLQDRNLQGFIEDLYLGTQTSLNMEGSTSYGFAIENKPASYASNRFRVVFKSALAPLPVTYVGIKAKQVSECILVTWNVENEIGLEGYDIEKSIDGINFHKVIHVPAKNIKEYNWLDKYLESANNYYRLNAINQNGKTELSNVVKVSIQLEPSKITVYPNPITNGVVNVHLVNQPSGKYKIRLLNPVGQVIINKIVAHSRGNSIHPITWDYKMARGMYQIEVTQPDGQVNLIKVAY